MTYELAPSGLMKRHCQEEEEEEEEVVVERGGGGGEEGEGGEFTVFFVCFYGFWVGKVGKSNNEWQ